MSTNEVYREALSRFSKLFVQAQSLGLREPSAAALATADAQARPAVRIVPVRDFDERGFVFYTNYESRKGHEISENARGALVFLWAELGRSVRIEGTLERISPRESDDYFATRPRDGQLSSLASAQSQVVESRVHLDRRFEELSRKYEGREISRPPHWGGYRLKPQRIEFWQARFARLNDRILYELQPDSVCTSVRLSP